MFIGSLCELTFKFFLQIYIGANEDSPLIQNCEDRIYDTCGIKKWKQPMRPLEIIVHYRYRYNRNRDEVEKDQKKIRIKRRYGIAQKVFTYGYVF